MTEFNSKIKQNSRILKIFLFSICALFACAINAHAQSLVQGTVTDETGESLPGVSVVVKGTTIIRKSKFPQNPKRSVRFSGKGTKRSVQKRKARNTQKAETKVL